MHRPNMRPPMLAAAGSFALAVAVTLAVTTGVFAHAQYDSSTPGKGERLTVAPTEVRITFTQEIQKIAGSYDIAVNRDRGSSVTAGPATVNDDDRTVLSVPLQPGLADGRYVVRWKNLSDADGDPLEGAFSFYLNYEPNTVDLANDADLELIGAEETPAGGTPGAGETPGEGETPAPDRTPADGRPTAAPTADGGEEPGEDDDSGTSTMWVIIGAIGIGLAAGAGAFAYARSRRSG